MKKYLVGLVASVMLLVTPSCTLPEGQTYAGFLGQVGGLVDAGKTVAEQNGLVKKETEKKAEVVPAK